MVTRYPWYEVVASTETLAQGDMLQDCPVIIPDVVEQLQGRVKAEVIEYDVIVMSQSCDIAQEKVDLILVCPTWPIEEFGATHAFFKTPAALEKLRRGEVVGYYLLNKCDVTGFTTNFRIVDFRSTYSADIRFLRAFAKQRPHHLRLLPPYREHLSQAFARFFMRVGLPVDIPPFKKLP